MKIKNKLNGLWDLILIKHGWGNVFTMRQRFAIASIFSFLAYYMFKNMGQLSAIQIDWLAMHIVEPSTAVSSMFVIVYGLFAFYLSILAASSIASLIPVWNEKN